MKRPIRRPPQIDIHYAPALAGMLVVGVGISAALIGDVSLFHAAPRVALWSLLFTAAVYLAEMQYYAPDVVPEPEPAEPEPDVMTIERQTPAPPTDVELWGVVVPERIIHDLLIRYTASAGTDTRTTRDDWPIAATAYTELLAHATGRAHIEKRGRSNHITYRGYRHLAHAVGERSPLPPNRSHNSVSPEVERNQNGTGTANGIIEGRLVTT